MSDYDNLQYQTFPDAPGIVDSAAKLKAFQLPNLQGKRFLDIGCNEGYYCGEALSRGASKVVGIDSYPAFIDRARKRFPNANFMLQTWDELPNEKFDVILFASAMHYIATEEQVVDLFLKIRKIMLPESVLILEVGINPGDDDWLVVNRNGESEVFYPSMHMFINIINKCGFIHREIGPSEPGDGVGRIVFHCKVYYNPINFVVGKSNIGKTRFCYSIFPPDSINLIFIDNLMIDLYGDLYPDSKIDLRHFNSLDLMVLDKGNEVVDIVADYVVKEILSRIEKISQSENPRSALVIDGLSFETDHLKSIVKLITARLCYLHPIWITQSFQDIDIR